MNFPSVSIITTCKGRWHHLRESLESMRAACCLYPGYADVIVVDYDCPDDTFDRLAGYSHIKAATWPEFYTPEIKAIKATAPPVPWSLSHARNVGAHFASGQVLAFIDCDNKPAMDYLTLGVTRMREQHAALCVPVNEGGRFAGACLVDAAAFHAVRGFDESLADYGWEDIDFYQRLESLGRPSFRLAPRCTIDGRLLTIIHHEDDDRVRFCASSKEESLANNAARIQDSSRAVNLAGYGDPRSCVLRGALYPPALRVLREDYPWPVSAPDLPFNAHGWLGGGNRRVLGKLLQQVQPRCVLEVGSWLGLSTRFFLEHSAAHVVAVDLWDHAVCGPEMLQAAGLTEERPLYEQFLSNQWDYRQRVTPLRAGTVAGIWQARDAGLDPDLIYIDAAHDQASFEADLAAAIECFPRAILCGDDWNWGGDAPTIQPALKALVAAHPDLILEVDKECWVVSPPL